LKESDPLFKEFAMRNTFVVAFIVVGLAAFVGCKSDAKSGGGKAPAKAASASFTISTDPAVIAEGEKLYASKTCSACHQLDTRAVGPPLRGVTNRRSPEWLQSMIVDPMGFVKTDPEAKKLFEEYKTPMATPPVSQEEARAIIAYMATNK